MAIVHFYAKVIMHSLRFELMSYLPGENYDTKALQQTGKKYNLLDSWIKM